MKLNVKKTKYMVINFTKNHQFNTRLHLEGTLLEQVNEAQLLGLKITDDLSWKSNTEHIVKKAYKRMSILTNLFEVYLIHQSIV